LGDKFRRPKKFQKRGGKERAATTSASRDYRILFEWSQILLPVELPQVDFHHVQVAQLRKDRKNTVGSKRERANTRCLSITDDGDSLVTVGHEKGRTQKERRKGEKGINAERAGYEEPSKNTYPERETEFASSIVGDVQNPAKETPPSEKKGPKRRDKKASPAARSTSRPSVSILRSKLVANGGSLTRGRNPDRGKSLSKNRRERAKHHLITSKREKGKRRLNGGPLRSISSSP